ncbi:hypothetical protein ACHQM5_029170 [Ranunculus cassubicifolius]
MPKEGKARSLSRPSPYPCSSRSSLKSVPEPPSEDIKEWEEARCPVCMEHPHNAVLLLCSSHEKGCRPYMCDTSYRHSNCLDQFRKSFAENSPAILLQEETSISAMVPETTTTNSIPEARINELEERGVDVLTSLSALQPVPCECAMKQKLVCPLCRGQINGWTVVDTARKFMNLKSRSCASETCEYSGSYSDLRKHARVEHPSVRPSVVNHERQEAWRTMERERDLGDVISTMRSALFDERVTDESFEGPSDSIFTSEDGNLLTVFFLFRVFSPGMSMTSSSGGSGRSGSGGVSRSRAHSSRSRGQSRNQRRASSTLWGETLVDAETEDSTAREDGNESSESLPDSWRASERRR